MRHHFATVRLLHKHGRQPQTARASPKTPQGGGVGGAAWVSVSDKLHGHINAETYLKLRNARRRVGPGLKNFGTTTLGTTTTGIDTNEAKAGWRHAIYPSNLTASEILGRQSVRNPWYK
jgi:hypothetical protein